MENDADFRNDYSYTYGASIALLFLREDVEDSLLHIPFTDYKSQDNYISFSYAHQIFTPQDLEKSELITDDRIYAGYSYFQAGLYQSYEKNLKSLIMQIGVVGPSSGMEDIHKFIHDLIGSPQPEGWDNQLKNELALQLNYSTKDYIDTGKFLDLDSVIIPEYGFELGNISTKAYTAALVRWGWNIPEDYGVSPIDGNSYSKIPLNSSVNYQNGWSFCFNFSAKANLVIRDIFLDGNSLQESHSVEKNYLRGDAGYGFSLAYDRYSLDYLRTHTTKTFKEQKNFTSYGSLLFSYNY